VKRGRKALLTTGQKIDVGGFCQDQWRRIMNAKAMARFEAGPHMAEIGESQEKVRRSKWKFVQVKESEKIDASLKRARKRRLEPLELKRPHGRADKVLGQATLYCWRKYRRRITREYARDCWDLFRKWEIAILRELKDYKPLSEMQ
jgi:hypothetical protein